MVATATSNSGSKVDLSLLIAKAIESDDIGQVFGMAPALASVSLQQYATYKAQLKAHFRNRLSLTDLERAVKELRQRRQSLGRKRPMRRQGMMGHGGGSTRDELPEDAIYLCDAANCELYYSKRRGYIAQKPSGKCRVLLGAAMQFERYASGNDPDAPRAFLECHVYLPGGAGRQECYVASLKLSRPNAKDLKCWQNLEGRIVDLPGDERDSLLAYKAISAHATKEVLAGRLVRQLCVGSFGWHSYQGKKYNARANGCIDAEGLHYGAAAPLAVQAPEGAAQRLPELCDITLEHPDGQVLLDLLNFWKDEGPTYFPLAMLFACSRIMLPDIKDAGRVEWQLELFARTQTCKTAIINYFFTTFFGEYMHNTATEMTDSKQGDSGVGAIYKEARLHGVAYMDIDYSKKPGHPLYEKYMERRLASLGKTRNKAGGGERGRMRGEGSEMRPSGGGLLVRTGETDPHEYSIAQCDDESTDAGACSFKYYGALSEDAIARKKRSEAIEAQRSHLHGIGILWTQWLARLDAEAVQERYQAVMREGDNHIAELARKGNYTHFHARTFELLRDMYTGAMFFLQFLSECEDIVGAEEIIAFISEHLDSFLNERLAESEQLALNYQENRGGTTQQDSLARKIRDTIYNEIHAGHVHLVNRDNKMPGDDDMPDGWTATPDAGYSEIEADGTSYRAGGVRLGIITPNYLYIPSKDFHPFLQKRLKTCPSKIDCQRALEQMGALVTEQAGEKKYYTVHLGRGGSRYIKLLADFIYGDDEEEPGGGHDEGAAEAIPEIPGYEGMAPAEPEGVDAAPIDAIPRQREPKEMEVYVFDDDDEEPVPDD